jgi:hypothetical protein
VNLLRLKLFWKIFTALHLLIIGFKKLSFFLQLIKVTLIVLFHLRSLASIQLTTAFLYFICVNACECLLLPTGDAPTLGLKHLALID